MHQYTRLFKKGTKTGICFGAIIEHYNYNNYYYTIIASVVLVFVVEIKNYKTLKLHVL